MSTTSVVDQSVMINIRLKTRQRELIDQAARSVGKNRSEFLLDAATRAAQETLLDQQLFQMDAGQWKKFNAALDAKPQINQRLRTVLAIPAPWER